MENILEEFIIEQESIYGRNPAEEALAQIQDRNYTLPFAIEDQRIVRIGINFDSKTRNIDKCLVG